MERSSETYNTPPQKKEDRPSLKHRAGFDTHFEPKLREGSWVRQDPFSCDLGVADGPDGAVDQNQLYHFGVGAPPTLVYFRGSLGNFNGRGSEV